MERDLFDAAAAYRGVPHVHGGDNRWGMDCVGLVAAALRDIGVQGVRVPLYTDERPLQQLIDEMDRAPFLRRRRGIVRGAICAFDVRRCGHLAIVDGNGMMVHSTIRGGVQVATMGEFWSRRLVATYEVANG